MSEAELPPDPEPGDLPVPPPGVILGLGPMWAPTPFMHDWSKQKLGSGQEMYLLRFSDPSGSVGYLFSKEELAQFLHEGKQLTTGLLLPPPPTIAAPGMNGSRQN